MTSNGRRRKVGNCKVCDAKKSQFVATTGTGFMNKLINRLPMEMHLPGHNFTGPGTKLTQATTSRWHPKAWSKSINQVDQPAYHHDLCYASTRMQPHATPYVTKLC
ncbi:Hypothetical predicted protein [Mytilus galloprovincialis]|uniref:Phospholipase A2-like domain-containing protein n=1 Tax=Mytilus galloprovincialis TaxID=29158 RepID=A0A8B6CJZ6_MYTGA|nr:Hypothetical predicted protein [Mytilus galloprovincialis]